MLLFIVFLQLFSVLKADYSVKCVNESISRTVFEPSTDGVSGRYNVEWCTAVNANARQWNLILSYNLAKNQSNCHKRTQPAHKHSEFSLEFEPEGVNCTHMCFYTSLDMIFNGCFVLENWLPAMGSKRYFLGQYVNNSMPRQAYTQNTIYADALNHGDDVAVHWYLDRVVATTFEMRLCENRTGAAGERRIIQNQVYVALPKEDRCEQVNEYCAVRLPRRNEITCTLRNLNGSYYIELTHLAPWKACNVFSKQVYTHYSFYVSDGRVSVAPAAGAGAGGVRALAWACGGVLALCAAAAAAACVWRARLARRLQQKVHTHWTCGDKQGIEPVAAQPDNTVKAVLLLYAREGDLGEPLIRALQDLLQQSGIKVLDLYSPEVVSESAPAPAGWLRAQLRAGARALLLQTPSLAALHGDRAWWLEAGAEAALLRAVRAVPAAPAPGDALLALALRLLAEDVHTPTPYNNYFLATLESLETETLPHIVPFRRYALPADAARLVLDLRPGAPPPARAALHTLRREADAFVQHVRDRPGYLKDHLLLLD